VTTDDIRRDLNVIARKRGTRIHFKIAEGSLSTEATSGGNREVSLSWDWHARFSIQLHYHDIQTSVAGAAQGKDLLSIAYDSFGEKKAGCQFEIVSGRPHSH
jgi:hypothetical protein